MGIYIQYIFVVLASEPVGGRSRATELPCLNIIFCYSSTCCIFHKLILISMSIFSTRCQIIHPNGDVVYLCDLLMIFTGCIMPLGVTRNTPKAEKFYDTTRYGHYHYFQLQHSEYIAYKEDQVCLRYIVQYQG